MSVDQIGAHWTKYYLMHELQCKGLATTTTINHSEARKVGGTHWEKLARQIFSTRGTERQSMLVTVNSANICNSFKHKSSSNKSSSIHQMKLNLGWIAQRLMWERKSWIQNYSLPAGKVLVLGVPKLQAYFQYMDTPSPSFSNPEHCPLTPQRKQKQVRQIITLSAAIRPK